MQAHALAGDLEIVPLPDLRGCDVRHMTYPAYRTLLYRTGFDTNVVGAALVRRTSTQGNEACGLALAYRETGYLKIASLYVAPALRGRRLGAQLLDWLVGEARAGGCPRLIAEFRVPVGTTPPVQRLMASAGFELKGPERLVVSVRAEKPTVLDWARRLDPGPGWQIANWHERGLSWLDTVSPDTNIPPSLHPARHQEMAPDGIPAMPGACLAITRHDRLVGWIFSHRLGPARGRVTASYLLDSSREARTAFTHAWSIVFDRQVAEGIDLCTFVVPKEYPLMFKMAERRFGADPATVSYSFKGEKDLRIDLHTVKCGGFDNKVAQDE